MSLTPPSTSSGRITVALARDDHAEELAAFYRAVWDQRATAESVVGMRRAGAASNVVSPGEPPPTALVLEGDRVVGYCSSIPQRLWDGAEERPAYWVKGLMVLPEFRNGPVGFLVLKELVRHLPCSTSMAVAPAARRLLEAVGYRDVGAVPNFIRALRPAAMVRGLDVGVLVAAGLRPWMAGALRAARRAGLATLAAAGAGTLLDAAVAVGRLPGRRVATEIGPRPEQAELDGLWRRVRGRVAAGPVRDGGYLFGRFSSATNAGEVNPYTFITAREQGAVAGVAVVRRPKAAGDPRLGSVRVAALSDAVYPPERSRVGLALLGAIERAARALGADALLATTGHRAFGSLLRRQGYARMAGNVHFLVRDMAVGHWPTELAMWWLSRGDGESDETF